MKNQHDKLLVFIVGPTAVGKTGVAVELAQTFHSAIISADSRQFYREMSIGTAKPSKEEQGGIYHALIDSHGIEDDLNAWDFEQEVLRLLDGMFKQHDLVFVTGGSGLYLHALWNGLDENIPARSEEIRKELNDLLEKEGIEALRKKLESLDVEAMTDIDQNNPVRLMRAIEICLLTEKPLSDVRKGKASERPFRMLKIGLDRPRAELHERIQERVEEMMRLGLEEEARSLIPYRKKNALQTVGYRELFRYFDGEYSLEEAVKKIVVNTRRYAKRQLTWFRRYPDIYWFHPAEKDKMIALIQQNRKQEI